MLTNEQKAVLAVFDGWEQNPELDFQYRKFSGNTCTDIKQLYQMPYDTDWNWIMPLYRKVMALPMQWSSFKPGIGNKIVSLKLILADLELFQAETPEPLAIALYNFITFYNEQNEAK